MTHPSNIIRRIQKLLMRAALIGIPAVLLSCNDQQFAPTPGPQGDALRFHTNLVETRAMGYTQNEANAIRSMGIYAAYTTDEWSDDAPLNYMTGEVVSRNDAASPWTYSPERYWPGSGYVSFFAYAPSGANGAVITPSDGTPSIEFTVQPDHNNQVDLLVSTPVKNQSKRDYVTIPLRHALTKIGFSARVNNTPPAGVVVKVTRIEFTNIYGKGTYPMDGSTKQWSGLNTLSSYVLTDASTGIGHNGLIPDKGLTDIYSPITPDDGYLLLLPQTLNSNARVKITYSVQSGNQAADVKTFELKIADAISQWRPGEAYNFLFTIDNGASFIVAPVEWGRMQVQADVMNRILNVTRIEANVHDAAVTRIFFWSNQPLDSVYVFPRGHMDNGIKQPNLSAPYLVDDIFQQLSGADAENLHYDGFVGTTASGEGYIDVIHTGDATENARHIWLSASGLTRNILLKSKLYTENNLPYIGTFHRRNQTGERILRWSADAGQRWTATILAEESQDENGNSFADHPQLLLDRFPSPAMENGSYGGSNPLDAELCPVDALPTGENSVSGMGNVYFRIGWKDAAPAVRNRYAKVKVTWMSGNARQEQILWLRQGHNDDFVMRPRDNSRARAVKWSPYNLTTPGSSESQTVNPAVNGGAFTTYPTQAGRFFQFAARTAYHPVISLSSWGTSEPVWNSLSHEICPKGYRRPRAIGNQPASTDYTKEITESLFAPVTTPVNKSGQGYYADGYFDRRTPANNAVNASASTVGYFGYIYYNPTSLASLFFPSAGSRAVANGALQANGTDYWTALNGTTRPYFIRLGSGQLADEERNFGLPVRCVRDITFETTLPDHTETYVPTVIGYNPDSSPEAVTEAFIHSWISQMRVDINALPTTPASLIRARMSFKGSMATNTVVRINVSTIAVSSRIAPGSTVTLAFDSQSLIWATGAQIELTVPSGWECIATEGSSSYVTTDGNDSNKARLSYKGTLVIKKKNN